MNKTVASWFVRPALVLAVCMAVVAPIPTVQGNPGVPAASVAYAKASTKVYITRTGAKYHRSWCRYLKRSKIKTTLKRAKSSGYGACKICRPPKK